jgi:ammonium transporter family
MVNITFDACGLLFFSLHSPEFDIFSVANDINWYNPATNQIQVYNLGNIAWSIAATALVWIMIPGVGFFYSGLLRRKNALSMIWLSMMTLAVVSFQVSRHVLSSCATVSLLFYSGSSGGVSANNADFSPSLAQHSSFRFSLAFSDTASRFIGDLRQFLPYFLVLLQNLTTTYRLLWPQRRPSATFSWEPGDPVLNVLRLPAYVRSYHTYARRWCPCGTRASWTFHGVRFHLVDDCLRSNRMLDMESQRLVKQARGS